MFEKLKEFVNAPIKDGIPGQATVVSASMPPDSATSANCRLRLTVQIPDHAPYNVEHTCLVKTTKWPWPGTLLPVSVDPGKLDHLRIDWDEVKTSREELDASFPLYGSDAAAAQGQGAPGVGGVSPQVNFQGLGGDMIERLEKLGKLRDSGVLTPQEFEEQKRKVLEGE